MPKKRFFRRQNPPVLWVHVVFLIPTVFVLASPALAHRVLVFAYVEGNTIHTESKFVPQTPVRQGEVQVLEQETGKVLVTGQTDDKGRFSFKIPPAAAAQKLDLKIVVEAGMGHRGEWLLKADSYLPGTPKAAAPSPPSSPAPTSPATAVAPGAKAATVERQMLEEALNQALERQLAPVKEMLAQLTGPRTSLPDIIGGLGYILGIFGLWAYFQSKRKKDS
jgi:nickel transport protein